MYLNVDEPGEGDVNNLRLDWTEMEGDGAKLNGSMVQIFVSGARQRFQTTPPQALTLHFHGSSSIPAISKSSVLS